MYQLEATSFVFRNFVLNMIHKFYFTNRVVDAWNNLPNWVVSANNINAFKKDLISIGNIKILYTIFEPKIKELKAAVRFCE